MQEYLATGMPSFYLFALMGLNKINLLKWPILGTFL